MNVQGKPDVIMSVIVPVYNHEDYLETALKSVQAQSVGDWECVIVDDDSTDASAEIAKRFVRQDGRFRYIYQQNQGVSGARNTGLSAAKGRYIQFLDSDDVLEKDKWKLQLEWLLQQKQPALSYCDYYRFEGSPVSGRKPVWITPKLSITQPLRDLILKWETEISIAISCFLFDAWFFKEKGICFDETLPNHVDWDCWIQIFMLKPQINYVDAKLVGYRLQPKGLTRDFKRMREGFVKAIEKHLNNCGEKIPEHRWFKRKLALTKLQYAPWRLLYWRKYYWYLKSKILFLKETISKSLWTNFFSKWTKSTVR